MKVRTSNRLRLEDDFVFVDIDELKSQTGFQSTFYQYGTHRDFMKQKVLILMKEKQISVLTTWEDEWKEVVNPYWHDAEVIYSWEEVKKD